MLLKCLTEYVSKFGKQQWPQCWDKPQNEPTRGSGAAEEQRKRRFRNKVRIRGLTPFAGKSPDPNPHMPFIANFYFHICALAISILYNLRLGIKIYNAQSSMANLQAFHDFV